jgi:hypothetical protein
MKFRDLSGKEFGNLVAISCDIKRAVTGRSRVYWNCRCRCGGLVMVASSNLCNGNTKSCGCRRVDVCIERTKHGQSSRNFISSEYRAWAQMMARCYRKTSKDYKNWGGRGITVCDRWRDACAFLSDMGPKPTAAHSLDRIDNDGNYEPKNCRWATRSQQNKNRRPFGSTANVAR